MIQKKAEKLPNLLEKIMECLITGNYRLSNHAFERQEERVLLLPDVLHVLENGFHEKAKDRWDELYRAWNYAIRGETVDLQACRVIVSFEDCGLLIITVIRLN